MEGVDSTRAFLKDVKRLVVKVGTAVVTRSDGRLAVGRLGALCEQIQELNTQGYEVILVTSGAVGVGRQRLRYRKLVNSSFADLQKPQAELDGKACAAVGQNGLMAIYDTLFSQLDVTSAQLLVTDNDFRDSDFRKQLTETWKSLLSLKVVPIFNENDAVSTRKAPYKEEFTTRATIAGQDLMQKQKFQLRQLVYLLKKIETEVNSSQNNVSQTISDHQVSMQKYFEKAIRYISTFYQSGQNYEAFLVTVQILKGTFSRVHYVLGSVEGDVDNLMHKLATLMGNPMIEYVKGMKAEITSGTFPRLLTILEEMVGATNDRRLELEEARMKVKGAEEWKVEALRRLEESEGRVRKMKL